MSRLISIHDFSPMRDITAALLNEVIPATADKNVVLGPFNSLLYEYVPTHTSLWTARSEKLPFPKNMAKHWDEIAAQLDSGKDVLLHTYAIFRPAHEFFHKQFEKRIDQQKHSFQSRVIIGSPLLLLELYYRHLGPNPAKADVDAYISRLLGLPDLVRMLLERYGKDSIKLFANSTPSAVGAPDEKILRQLMESLALPLPEKLPETAANAAFRSQLSRRLRNTMEVRDNSWPFINPDLIGEALHKTDADLPEDICSPLEVRQNFAARSQAIVRELEQLLNLDMGALAPPPYLLSDEKSQPHGALPAEIIASFRSNLGTEAEKKLQERLHNDELLLTADQKSILEQLDADSGFSIIGEPRPSLELTVLTMTYNHEKFIAQCMDSVLAQKTDFPVQHIVLDHHSEDRTAEIIASYARQHPSIRPVLLSHRRSNENVYGLFARSRSRYVALCDGDDYFLEPDKLQKQVDYLEKNPDCSICFHPVLAVFEDGRKPSIYPPLDTLPKRKNAQFYLSDLISTNFIQTNSAVYRWRFTAGLPQWFRPDLCPGDWYWHLLHAEMGKIGFIPEIMSAYRRHSGALYAQTMHSRLEHRRNLGMPELGTYQAVDDHFKRRYHRPLSVLASSVFSDFVEIMMKEDDDKLLNWAVEKYPDFARDFLNSLSALEKKQKTKQGEKENG